jgi:type III restriction enzyme
MAMAVVWSYFQKRCDPDSTLSTNFLILAPNVIVYERLARDFAGNEIFNQLPLMPDDLWPEFQLKPIMRLENVEFSPHGNLILTNIQQLQDRSDQDEPIENAVERLLGRKPVKDMNAYGPNLFERLKGLPDIVSINDEAHHLHDDDKLVANRRLLSIHEALRPQGLSLWLDFSATPKGQTGRYFPWTVVDYPLAQAVEDRIVKVPTLVHREDRAEPFHVTVDQFANVYSPWLLAAVDRLRHHEAAYKPFGVKPVLFIMTERNNLADELKKWLVSTDEVALTEDEVLLIHTDSTGDVAERDLPELRKLAGDVDNPNSKVKVVVSVMMLKEGWDVKNVTVVLGLRPFSAKAGILPEQAIGRGLRLIPDIGFDVQTLEVMGSEKFEKVIRGLDQDGVPWTEVTEPPPLPVRIEPVRERSRYDIRIPLTAPTLERDFTKIEDLDILALRPIWEADELPEVFRIALKGEFWPAGTSVALPDVNLGAPPLPGQLTSDITVETEKRAGLTGQFSRLRPKVESYLVHRCLGRTVALDDEAVRAALRGPIKREAIGGYLATEIGKLAVEHKPLRITNPRFLLSDVKPFTWRRKHCRCEHTVFNYVATFNDFEVDFANFVDAAADVDRFAALGTTEQDANIKFRIDYIKSSGARGFYYPDWIVIQGTENGEVGWIVETKGREWEGTANKDAAAIAWCAGISSRTGEDWRYVRVNQPLFEGAKFDSFQELIDIIERRVGQTALLQASDSS